MNPLKPLVTILIPTYNRLRSLAELVESLSRQTFQNFDIIIVNDCGEKVDCIKVLYPELTITIIDHKINQKHVHARNTGMQLATGEFIMLVDDDDLIVLPSHLELMLEEIKDCDLAYPDCEIINYRLENGVRMPTSRLLFAYELDFKEMRKFSTFFSSGCLYRREIHHTLGLFDTDVYHYWDWDFFLRVSESYRVKRVPVASVLYEFSDTGANQSKNLDSMAEYLVRLSQKHNLGSLPTKNFFLLLDEPELQQRKAKSRIVWDGRPVISRLALDEGFGE